MSLHSVAGGLSQRTDAVLHAVSAGVVQAVFTPFDVHVPHAVCGYLPVPVLKVEPAAQDGAVPPASTQHWKRKRGKRERERRKEEGRGEGGGGGGSILESFNDIKHIRHTITV